MRFDSDSQRDPSSVRGGRTHHEDALLDLLQERAHDAQELVGTLVRGARFESFRVLFLARGSGAIRGARKL